MPLAFLCDFDGTVAPHDIGAAFVRRFSNGRERELDPLLERWRAGQLGHRELTEAECRLLTVTEDEALAFARRFEVDPDFPAFVRDVEERGGNVAVASEGFDFYVRDLLARAGLADLEWTSNGARFVDGGLEPRFAAPESGCGACGNCKGAHVERRRHRGDEVILVGDGLSDRCGARAADGVLARGNLLDWCRREGIPATPFESFAGVHEWARAAFRAREPGMREGGLDVPERPAVRPVPPNPEA